MNSSTGPIVPHVDRSPVSEPLPGSRLPASPATKEQDHHPLFTADEVRDFRARWDQIQTAFVDEPRHALELADSMIATVTRRIAEKRASLGKPWPNGDNISTEELRQGFQRYRDFFDRLLAI